jgi:hypothetical protein
MVHGHKNVAFKLSRDDGSDRFSQLSSIDWSDERSKYQGDGVLTRIRQRRAALLRAARKQQTVKKDKQQ